MSKFIVLKADDIKDHLNWGERAILRTLMERVRAGREAAGKAVNNYVVINQDEPYINEVTDIMKKHGHWEGVEKTPGDSLMVYDTQSEDVEFHGTMKNAEKDFECAMEGLDNGETAYILKVIKSFTPKEGAE
ncbi:hypothetical protein [Bacillus halotolerans]|uniref:hypothetical protein n=1 Tax=Bacillus halotolerans TaxID=260554 RepID=UPI00404B9DA6